ncbi:calcium-binding protein [Jannaschia aquimarina]|uniref:Cya_6 protein n=1 Tax=Jannaschia aquimarina TaxID=935700 RepID=A0A0D1CIT4_9RHOB|nr:calcium-binding protein [Jannaschia aquimarina]KIT14637.1 Bifunctional hemolysin/adenylate cyclase precursor [Jannaschia aquimarina]SNT37513.1 hypothetical protein SAMN05421775_11368 [Jannaschia aquimarina]
MVARLLDFNFAAGTRMDDEYADLGVTIRANQRHSRIDQAMIFDSSDAGRWDSDLDYSDADLGGLLMISQDGRSDRPNDSFRGGTLKFDFDEPVDMTSVTLLDAERGAKIKAYDENGKKIGVIRVENGHDNDMREIDLSIFEGVASLKIILRGSGAIDNLAFDAPGDDDTGGGGPGGDDTGGSFCSGGDASLSFLEPGGRYNAQTGETLVQGSDGADTIAGNAEDNTLYGNGGNDFLLGNTGIDRLCGGAGDDTLHGGRDDDTVVGGAGDDRINGDKGSDVLVGGDGADAFAFSFKGIVAGDLDTVKDFDAAKGDWVMLRGFEAGTVEARAVEAGVELTLNGDAFAIVENAGLADVENALTFV